MEVSDVHVGKQLQVNFTPAGSPTVPPLCFGFGPTAVPGTGSFNGAVLIGSPLSFPIPNVPEAALMVGRPLIKDNPLAAAAPSIFKVTSRASHLPVGTPIDVMLGDPTGPVGVTCFCGIQPFTVQSAAIELLTIAYNLIAPARSEIGASSDIGAKVFSGAKTSLSADFKFGVAFNGAPSFGVAPKEFPDFSSKIGSVNVTSLNATYAQVLRKKDFDIEHPNKKGWRLRHVCIEGPTADVYIRGKLVDSNIIELPSYWNGLVNPETITINLTPIGAYQELFVEKIEWGKKIIVKNNSGGIINCSYLIQAERIDVEKNIVEYEGNYEDYPGDNSEYMSTIIKNK